MIRKKEDVQEWCKMKHLQSPDAFGTPEVGDAARGRNAGSREHHQMAALRMRITSGLTR